VQACYLADTDAGTATACAAFYFRLENRMCHLYSRLAGFTNTPPGETWHVYVCSEAQELRACGSPMSR